MAEEDRWTSIVAGGDASPVLQVPEHDLDTAAAPVATLVVAHGCISRLSPRNAGLHALRLQGVPEPVVIIATIAEQPLCLGQIVKQRGRLRVGCLTKSSASGFRAPSGAATCHRRDGSASMPYFAERVHNVRFVAGSGLAGFGCDCAKAAELQPAPI